VRALSAPRPIPIDQFIKKYGANEMVEFAPASVRCSACKRVGARAVMLRLCNPDCPRQRGLRISQLGTVLAAGLGDPRMEEAS
jgi:hypothetical protein